MLVNNYKDSKELTGGVADWLVTYIGTTLNVQEKFTIALSGGNTPKQLFTLLASDAYRNKIDWQSMHFFWGDERAVAFNDDQNNANVAIKELLNRVPVPPDQIHRMETSIPEQSANKYSDLLHSYFDNKENSFDLVMLGLGEDGHTLSVFPNSPILQDHESWVRAVFVPDQDMWRITLTPVIVNKAKKVIFLVSGSSKSDILYKILRGDQSFPASSIHPSNGELIWFTDIASLNP